MKIGKLEIRWIGKPVPKVSTTKDWLIERLEEQIRLDGGSSERVLTPFEAGILFSDRMVPLPNEIHTYQSDFGKLRLLIPENICE